MRFLKSRLLPLVLALVLLLSLGGCKKYEDTNGPDDYSLQTLTEADLVSGKTGGSSVGRVESNVNDTHKLKIKTFNGVESLQKFKRGDWQIELSFQVTKGNARLYLCSGGEILHEFQVNRDNQYYAFTVDSEDVSLRIAGEDCGFTLQYEVRSE